MREAFVTIFFGMVVGAYATVWVLTHEGNTVTVQGTKDSFQTVTWQGKNYRLVPLDIQKGKP